MLKANRQSLAGQASDPVADGALPVAGADQRVRRVLLIADSHDQAAQQDQAFWRSASIEDRWQAVELQRMIAYGYEVAPRVQRVLEITQRVQR